MKKRLIKALSSIPIIAAMALSGDSCAAGCPLGMVNCPYPGQCSRYVDATGDGLCDLSQTTTTSTSDTSTSNDQVDPNQVDSNDSATSVDNQDALNGNATHDPDNGFDGGFLGDGDSYYILPVSLLLISGYLLTYYLFKKGILKRSKHRRIWNLLLTAGYLGTSGTGILLVLLINLGIKTALNPSITFWHVELSILMVIGTLIHVHIYWKPFKNMFRVLFGFKSPVRTRKKSPLSRKKKTPDIFINSIKK